MIDEETLRLIRICCEERTRLRREMMSLTNEKLAEKFELPVKEIQRIAKYLNVQRPQKEA